uniref:Mex-3 RNA binding family member D n=1 Tax=Amphilophus citrinellus TaxID=61819 RepID=A0A3Q0SIG7_AMPCI
MPSPLFHPEIMDHDVVISSQHNGVGLSRETDQESREEDHQEALRFALDQLSLMALEKVDCGGGGSGSSGGGGFVDLQMLDHPRGYHMAGSHPMVHGEQSSVLCSRKRSVNMTECVPVPSSEHVAEIVGRQGCKIKALRAKTNTYIKTPVRGEDPVFIVTGRREDVEMAKREIVSAAEHFSMIRASRCKAGGPGGSGSLPGPPNLPGQTTIQVRVPYRVVGLVVGPKGATIKRIQQQTHTYIVTPSREKDPVFEVTGMPENVDRAREEIETHITLRTGTFVDLQGDNDFHTNGTDVSLEGLSSLSGGLGASFPFSTSSSSAGGFTFGGESTPGLASSDELGFEFSASNIWAPFVNSGTGSKTASSSQQQPLRRNSSGLSGGAITPRLSPTLPQDTGVVPLDHPLARRAQSDPLIAGLVGVSPGLNRDCFVCFESEVTAALVPCGHNLFCMECAGQICQSAEPECPVCHTPTTQCIRIFS